MGSTLRSDGTALSGTEMARLPQAEPLESLRSSNMAAMSCHVTPASPAREKSLPRVPIRARSPSTAFTPASDDVATLRAALLAEQSARRAAGQRVSDAEAIIARIKLTIAQIRHNQFGASSERGRKLLDQLELQLEEAEAAPTEDNTAVGSDA